MSKVLHTHEIMERLGIGRSYLYRLLHSEGFPVIHLGRRMVVTEEALDEWLRNGGSVPRESDSARRG